MKILKKCVLTFSLCCWMPTVCLAQKLDAFLNKTEVAYGEPVELKIVYEGSDLSDARPDLDGLRKDFSIYSSSTSMQTSMINGKTETQKSWTIGLLPRKEGKLTIPEIAVGNYKTSALEVNILNQEGLITPTKEDEKSEQKQSAEITAELVVDHKNPYVQQEINAVLLIHDQKGLQLSQEPVFDGGSDWIIRSLGRPVVEYKKNNEREIRFNYALFPQKSGKLKIPSAQIDGYYESFDQNSAEPSTIGGFFRLFEIDIDHMFGVQKPVSLRTKAQEIDVLPIDPTYGNSWWLPARKAAVAAKWETIKPEFKVGQAVAREITFTAQGVDERQIPEIKTENTKGVKHYPEQPKISSFVDEGYITSKAVVRIVYIPQKAGEIIIPAIEIPWFNTMTNQVEKAVVPAQKIVAAPMETDEIVHENEKENLQTDFSENSTALPLKTDRTRDKTSVGLWLCIILSFLAGMIVSYFGLRQNKAENKTSKKDDALKKIKESLDRNDYRSLRDALINFGKQHFPNKEIRNVRDLSLLMENHDFSTQMELLNGILYADQNAQLDKDLILTAIKNVVELKMKDSSEKEPLPKLYK